MYSIRRLLHFIAGIAFVLTVFLAFMNEGWFSKEAIMQSFSFSLPFTGYEIAQADQFFISRMLRREGWQWHFWAGAIMALALVGIALLSALTYKMKTAMRQFAYLIAFGALVLFISGFPLWVRAYTEVHMDIQDLARKVHYYSAWAFGLTIALHTLYSVFKYDILKRKDDDVRL